MEDRTRTFPVLKLPLSKKTEEWRKACVDYCIGAGVMTRNTNFRTSLEEMQSYYDLYNSIFNEKDLKYVTNPFKLDDGFPATAQDHNIIRPKIDLLLGEETKRPFNFHVCRTSDIAAGDIQDKAKKMLMDYIMASILAKMSPEDQQRFQEALESGEIMEPEQIHEYLTKEYKDVAEITAHHTLNYLIKKDNVLHEFFRGWKDYLIAGEEYFYVGILNGEPIVERVNPMEFSYELSSNEQFVHEADNCCRHMVMSANEIYDRLYDKMSEKDLDELLDLINEKPGTFGPDKGPIDDFNSIRTRIFNTFPHTNPFDRNGNIDVWHCCWRSYTKMGFVTVLDEYGNPDTIEVDETYNVTGEELNVEWEWVTEIWEGYRIGDAMYVGIQPLEYQHISADNPNAQKLPYTGIVASATNSKPKSLVSIMKPLQYWYIMLWYRLELALARDKGKILTMDITLIPKSMGIDVNKWLHYISALGINLINPYDEGWDVPGREGGKPSQFNLISAMDASMSNVIGGYIDIMSKIESMVSELTGITPLRQGAISSSELVGNVERSVTQSANITEPLYWDHNQVKKHVLTMLLDTAKSAWQNSNKEKLHYIYDDGTRAFLNISEDFLFEDFDLFVTDSTKDNQTLELMRQQLIQPAMQNGASLLDAAEVLTIDNITKMKAKLAELEQKRAEMEQQRAQQEQEAQQQLVQMQNEVKESELMLREAELDLQRYKIDQDNATKIAVAQLNAYRGVEEMDQDSNGIPDVIEIGKQALEEQKIQRDEYTKNKEIQFKKDIEDKKIALEKQKIQAAQKLQKQKDDAAMEREKLKAKTQLLNKVVGEN